MMTKEQAKALWLDYTEGNLEEEEVGELNAFFEVNPDVKEEFESLSALWSKMDDLSSAEPSPNMDMKFHAMLEGYEVAEEQQPNGLSIRLENFIGYVFQSKLAFASLMLVIGIGFGYLISSPSQSEVQLSDLNAEIYEMKKVMMLTLMDQPKALDRLKAVQISNEIPTPDEKVVDALLKALNTDPNVNVRLVAAQSLATMADNPVVRAGLVGSISKQTSPILQNSLADIMLELMEKNAVSEFEKLLEQPNLDTLVVEKIQTTIETLI